MWPEVLDVAGCDVAGCIVTIDAMGCQKDITEAITKQEADQEADYVLALKDNHGQLRTDTEAIFKRMLESDFEAESGQSRAGMRASQEGMTASKPGVASLPMWKAEGC